jgi:hypothetical protein
MCGEPVRGEARGQDFGRASLFGVRRPIDVPPLREAALREVVSPRQRRTAQ